MKKSLLSFIVVASAALTITSCSKDDTTATVYQTEISGYAEKGVFQKGSTVTITVCKDSAFADVVKTLTTTVDTQGYYKLTGDITGRFVKVVVSGKYYDETDLNNGTIDGEVTALVDAKETKAANVNILTDLEATLASKLIEANKINPKPLSFKQAKDSALRSLVGMVSASLTPEQKTDLMTKGAEKLRLSDGDKVSSQGGDVLLKFSAAIISTAKAQKVDVATFIKTTVKGTITDPTQVAGLATTIQTLLGSMDLTTLKAAVKSVRDQVQATGAKFYILSTIKPWRELTTTVQDTLAVGKKDTILVRIQPRNALDKTFTFSSSDAAKVEVARLTDSTILVTAKAAGNADISVIPTKVTTVVSKFTVKVN